MQPPYDAVIFDMDGGVTAPASVDGAAWKLLFDEALADPRALADGPPLPFDAVEDYHRYVDDRRRGDAAVAVLEARGVDVPLGTRRAVQPPSQLLQRLTVHNPAPRLLGVGHAQGAPDGARPRTLVSAGLSGPVHG